MNIDQAAKETAQILSNSAPYILALSNLPWGNDLITFAQLYVQLAASVKQDRLLLDTIIQNEVQNSELQLDILFRTTNFNISIITSYFQLYSGVYIQKVIGPVIRKIIKKNRSCDINKNSKKVAKHTKNLYKATSSILNAIVTFNPKDQLLAPLRYACYRIYDTAEKLRPGLGIPSVAVFFMLRLIGPILTKNCVNNNSKAARSLILVAKLLQCMCNNSLPNEEYLGPLHPFIVKGGWRLNLYLQELSSSQSVNFSSTNIIFNTKDCITMVNLFMPYWPILRLNIKTYVFYDTLCKNIELLSKIKVLETGERTHVILRGSLIIDKKEKSKLERNLTGTIILKKQ